MVDPPHNSPNPYMMPLTIPNGTYIYNIDGIIIYAPNATFDIVYRAFALPSLFVILMIIAIGSPKNRFAAALTVMSMARVSDPYGIALSPLVVALLHRAEVLLSILQGLRITQRLSVLLQEHHHDYFLSHRVSINTTRYEKMLSPVAWMAIAFNFYSILGCFNGVNVMTFLMMWAPYVFYSMFAVIIGINTIKDTEFERKLRKKSILYLTCSCIHLAKSVLYGLIMVVDRPEYRLVILIFSELLMAIYHLLNGRFLYLKFHNNY